MSASISVVVPAYNSENTLKRCVESILAQSKPASELILINDGSCDYTGIAFDQYALNQCNVLVVHQPNLGVSAARNAGIEIASAEFVLFVDSDDTVMPNWIEDFEDIMIRYPQAGHYWCGFRWLSHKTDIIYSEKEPVSSVTRNNYMFLFQATLVQSPWLRLYRRSVLNRYHIRFDTTLSLAEDVCFNLEYLDKSPNHQIVILNKANYVYMDMSIDSLNSRFRSDLADIYNHYHNIIYSYLIKWLIKDKESWNIFYNTVFYDYILVMRNTFHPKNDMSFFSKFSYNNSILRSKMFHDVLNKRTCEINLFYYYAYKTQNYLFVLLADKLVQLKKKVFQ